MSIVDWIVVAALVLVAGAAVWHVRRAKKKGRKCIGCPDGGHCASCNAMHNCSAAKKS